MMAKSRQLSQGEIAWEVRAVPSLSREALIARWTSAYGGPPPKTIGRRLLERAAAYHLQIACIGGISSDLKRRLARLAQADDAALQRKPRDKRPSPGTRLVREWNGRAYTVEVAENGFHWNGQQWASLSAVATAITGVRWSGPRFFGL
ncbi:MAG: DUF2924 domain-containing protein [Bauldia sp.]